MDLIKMIRTDDLIGAKKELVSVMAGKLKSKIEDLRKEVGSNLYTKKETDA